MKRFHFLFLLLIPALGFSQKAIFQKVMEAQQRSADAPSYQLMTEISADLEARNVSVNELREGLVFEPALDQMQRLIAENSDRILMEMVLPGEGRIELDLVKHKLLTDDFILSLPDGSTMKYRTGAYYHGIISGDENSLVAISVFDNEVRGFISKDRSNFVVGKLEKDPTTHVIYNDKNLTTQPNLDCATPDDGQGYTAEMLQPLDASRDVGDCIRVYVEIDNDIVVQKGGATPASNYITGMFNESITLYANESLAMAISEIKAWTTTSPYSSNSSSGMLSDFQNNTGAINGDLGHLVSYQASGGIAAGFSGICNSNPDNSKCFSSVDATYNNVPSYSFSVMVVTHEMGHLIGSRHTHACVWNGNNTAIDGCAGGTEGSCSLPGSPSGGGTIMSYCHLTTGIDFNQGFGPQPGNVIRNTVANASCLNSGCGGGGPTCFDGVQNGQETGVDCGGPDCPACPTPCTDTEVTLTINLDNYPEETSWDIRNASGTVVASGGTYGSQPDGSTVTETACLPDGCYDFTIYDSYGDGICCGYGNGSYSLTNGATVLASGGAFGSSELTNFCLGGGPAPTCTDGIQNGQETGVDCGGPDCPACPTCTDGVQNGQETDVDCGGPDCPACPTCTDGVQNGQETGVDCGGPDCPACPPGGTTTLFGSYFETGWDGWTDGGSDCFRYSGGRSWEGSYSIRIRDNSGSNSAMTYSGVDLTGYTSVDFSFYFYPNSMETGEDFWLRFNDGSGWQTVAAWASGTSFTNNSFYTTSVTISAADFNFGPNCQFRIQCDASANADRVYIDEVFAIANSGGALIEGTGITNIEKLGPAPETPANNISMTEVDEIQVQMFPNPAQDRVTLQSNNEIESIQIISINGQVVRTIEPAAYQKELILSDLNPGIYYIMVQTNGEIIPQKLVKL